CRSGEIGRHARFRGVCRKTCGVESHLRHQTDYLSKATPKRGRLRWWSRLGLPSNLDSTTQRPLSLFSLAAVQKNNEKKNATPTNTRISITLAVAGAKFNISMLSQSGPRRRNSLK